MYKRKLRENNYPDWCGHPGESTHELFEAETAPDGMTESYKQHGGDPTPRDNQANGSER